ncbi:hypothetical protein B0H17DRAFT_1082863 [Mycena rosella]|uniref:Uncharacterized protein n=1 Tax=Mycena rosella TaxID=1033263 RepID=A0AAD7D1H6_MYCRO|nr:hypothetical protein B0H17DRAFT_1082863 [Mycena rosella]
MPVKSSHRFWKTRLNTRGSRNPGRRDGFLWNGNAFICPGDIDGFRCDLRGYPRVADAHDAADLKRCLAEIEVDRDRPPTPGAPHEVAILDIARHARLKGVAKEFELLEAPRRIIALEEDVFPDGPQFTEDDAWEWEDIDEFDLDSGVLEDSPRKRDSSTVSGTRRRAYADVLRGAMG